MKKFIVIVSHFICGEAETIEEVKEKMRIITDEEVSAMKEIGFETTQEYNEQTKQTVGAFKRIHTSKVDGLTDTVVMEYKITQ